MENPVFEAFRDMVLFYLLHQDELGGWFVGEDLDKRYLASTFFETLVETCRTGELRPFVKASEVMQTMERKYFGTTMSR